MIVRSLNVCLFGALLLGAAPVAKAPIVFVESVKKSELADTITYPARVVSRVQAQIYAPADGEVSHLKATLGQTVRAGEKLLAIKNTDPVYEYVPVPVQSPVSGVLSTIDVSEGARVTKGQALATVIDPKQIHLLVEVPAADVAAIRPGLTGSFGAALLGQAAKTFDVKVSGISPLIDPATGTATAELVLSGANERAVPLGAIGKVSFAINRRQGVQVPEQAIVYRGKETLVRTVENGKAKMTPVTVAATRKGLTEITGLNDGAVIVVRASGFIADGQDVVVQDGDVAKK